MEAAFFTHIPKTAGTSVWASTFHKKFADENVRRFQGYWDLLMNQKSFRALYGHYAYGVHLFRPTVAPLYFVMLREPVSRLLSYYYFYKQSTAYESDVYQEADTKSFTEFCANPRHQNVQTRFVAGVWWEYVGKKLSLNNAVGRYTLEQARRNLTTRYTAFGLKSQFRPSVELFARILNVESQIPEKRHHNTDGRPRKEDLSDATIAAIRNFNTLDVTLYEYAVEHFNGQW